MIKWQHERSLWGEILYVLSESINVNILMLFITVILKEVIIGRNCERYTEFALCLTTACKSPIISK